MITRATIAEVDQEISLAQRREYMMLPLAERRQRLAAQAERMATHYEEAREQAERLDWQGDQSRRDDIV